MAEASDATQLPAPAPPKGGKCLGLACLGMVGFCVLFIAFAVIREQLKSPEEKAADAKRWAEIKAADRQKGQEAGLALAKKFAAIAKVLPAPATLAEKPAPELKGKVVKFTSADAGFFGQFDDTGYVAAKDSPYVWYRASKLDEAKGFLKKVAAKEDFYPPSLVNLADEFAEKRYLGVIYPVEVHLPKMAEDKKSFAPGFFDGWVVLVELDTAKIVRQARFTAESSDKISNRGVKIVGIKIAPDAQKKLEENFHTNFFAAALEAIMR
jgi:hypothetical protein